MYYSSNAILVEPHLTSQNFKSPKGDLKLKKESSTTKFHSVSAVFLFIFSVVTFHNTAFAGLFSNVAEEYHSQGYEAQLKGDYREALAYYYKAVATDPEDAAYQNDLGLVYEHLGQDKDAEASYLNALALDPQYLPPYANLGFLYKKKQNYVKAIFFLQKRIDLGDPTDPWTQKTREELEKLYDSAPHYKEKFVKAQAQRMNLQVSQSARQNFQNQMHVANAEYERGVQLLKAKKTADAVRAFNASLAFAPENPKVVKARDEAVRQFRKEQVMARAEAAVEMMDQGKEEAAKQEFNRILTMIPNQPKQ
jgi:tetratricopeptide (TPR) repeat protein